MVLHGRIRLYPLSSQILYHECIPVIVSRFTIFTENLVISCYQVTKFSARSTAVPVCFLQEAPVILVRLQISQFLSFGEWVWILCFLDTTLKGRFESETWEVFAGVSLNAGTAVSARFSVNSFNHAGRSRIRLLDAWLLSSFWFMFFVFVGSLGFLDVWAWVSSLCCIAGPGEIAFGLRALGPHSTTERPPFHPSSILTTVSTLLTGPPASRNTFSLGSAETVFTSLACYLGALPG